MSQHARSKTYQNHVQGRESSDQSRSPQNDGLQKCREPNDQGPELEKDDSKRRTIPKPSGTNQKKPPDFPSPDRSTVNSVRSSECSRPSALDPRRTKSFRFENLEVWHGARFLNRQIYRITRKFPSHEQYGLTSQVRRASVSVSSNIAEGSGRNSDKDFAHFLKQAYGSLMEVASQIFVAIDLHYVSQANTEPLFGEIDRLAGKIVALNRSMGVASSKITFKTVDRQESNDQG